MRKYLEYYENEWPENIAELRAIENGPFVGYSIEESKVVYTEVPKPADPNTYVTFTAEEDNSSIGLEKLSTNQIMEYSIDTITWNTFDKTTNISLNNGDKVYVRGILNNNNNNEYENYTQFKMTGKIAASGNCNAIWNYQDLNAPLKTSCGCSMFEECISLITAPELPATTLADYCYWNMFKVCTSLTTAPELPATTLADGCYGRMFNSCTSLTTAPELPATTLAWGCYRSMFQLCSSLTTAPKILPATELTSYCYFQMFYYCRSLTTAPTLPATVLVSNCYDSMFHYCTQLNHITCLATYVSAYYCTYNWVYKVPSIGTFIKHPDMNNWSTGDNGIPSGWTVEDAEI